MSTQIQIQFNSLFHFTQGNTILTVYQIIYINNKFYKDFNTMHRIVHLS